MTSTLIIQSFSFLQMSGLPHTQMPFVLGLVVGPTANPPFWLSMIVLRRQLLPVRYMPATEMTATLPSMDRRKVSASGLASQSPPDLPLPSVRKMSGMALSQYFFILNYALECPASTLEPIVYYQLLIYNRAFSLISQNFALNLSKSLVNIKNSGISYKQLQCQRVKPLFSQSLLTLQGGWMRLYNSKLTTMQYQKASEQPKIRVVIRKRPLNRKETARGEQDVVAVAHSNEVIVREQKAKVDLTKYLEEHHFKFDHALPDSATNQEMYEECVRPIVHCAFLGAKVTCFAYGQTGSGKTYTMNGDAENGVLGMYYLGGEDIFALRDQQYPQLEVFVSFYEIYCGKLFDLLNQRELLQAREDAKQNVNIVGLTTKRVATPREFMEVISYGSGVRITSQNSTNSDSSRSHAILQIELRSGKKAAGKISFIDLAGCERGADTIDQNKQTKIDGAEINKSLLALKECIRALDLGKNHTPFRGSKLTMVLKDSFTGFCKTLMIGNISPGSGSCENTLNTLRYADRVKELKKGGGGEAISKEERLAKELMLPRNGKATKLVITNSSDQEDNSSQLKEKNTNISQVTKNPQQCMQQSKKPKYILKDENDRSKNSQTPLPYQPRKNIMNNDSNIHNQPLKSVNAARKPEMQRNKSVICREKSGIVNSTSWVHQKHAQPPLHSERNSFNNYGYNPSPNPNLHARDLKDINVHLQKLVQKSRPEYSEWEQAVQRFKRWTPSSHNFGEMSALFESMVGLIMKEEVEVSELHKAVLLQEERQHQQLVTLYQETQLDNKNNEEMHDYAERLSALLGQRLTMCNELKLKAETYQHHLREHEYCEARLMECGQALEEEHYSSVHN